MIPSSFQLRIIEYFSIQSQDKKLSRNFKFHFQSIKIYKYYLYIHLPNFRAENYHCRIIIFKQITYFANRNQIFFRVKSDTSKHDRRYIIYSDKLEVVSMTISFKMWKVCRFNPDWISNSIPPTLDKSTNRIRKSSTLVTDVYRHFVYFSTRGNK